MISRRITTPFSLTTTVKGGGGCDGGILRLSLDFTGYLLELLMNVISWHSRQYGNDMIANMVSTAQGREIIPRHSGLDVVVHMY